VLFGNVLHYFADPLPLLRAARTKLKADGAVVVLEYEGARANPWVPHPVSLRRLGELAHAAQLGEPDVVSERRRVTTARCTAPSSAAEPRDAPPPRPDALRARQLPTA
jgi:hypothetical protein